MTDINTVLSKKEYNICVMSHICSTFALTAHTTLPVRTASQGVSFAFIPFRSTSLIIPLYV
jgi:hypothetical protein